MPRKTNRHRTRRASRPPVRVPKYVYAFANGRAEGSSAMRDLLGGKGCELAEMTKMDVPVPPGFTISTEAWAAYNAAGKKHPAGLWDQVMAHLSRLQTAAGNRLGDPARPLLVSVRSGARVSMPGMMDTVLNLGLNDQTVLGLAQRTRNERFAWDCYRRFITLFGDVVLSIDRRAFDAQPGLIARYFEPKIERIVHEANVAGCRQHLLFDRGCRTDDVVGGADVSAQHAPPDLEPESRILRVANCGVEPGVRQPDRHALARAE